MSVRVERQGAVWTVILDRPGVRNAVDGPTGAALAEAFRSFETDPQAAAAVFWGAGGCFCAGADLKAYPLDPDARRLSADGDGPMGPTRLRLNKPVIAAVAGYAVAGGLELALWCDLRVVEESAVLGVFCRRWGVPLIDGGTVRLPRLIGLSRALDLILTGRPVSAGEALSMGLAHRVVPDGTSREAAQELARQLAAFPQECLRQDRASALEQFGRTEPEALAEEFRGGRAVLEAAGTRAGVRRFLEGRGRHGRFDD